MNASIESRVLFFSEEISRCIKNETVVSRLGADFIISSDECSRLKKLYLDGDPFKANGEMINCLQKSTAKGKWRSFFDALEKSEYDHLKALLESTDRPQSYDERERNIIRVFSPYLEKRVMANDIVTYLYSRNVINDRDAEYIRAISTNKGETYATIELLERMQCRLSPDKWFYEFLNVLVQTGSKDVVREIEPDFLVCPERYLPCEGKGTSSCGVSKSQTETHDHKGVDDCCNSSMSEDIIEHTVTDCGNAEEDMDEGVPILSKNADDPYDQEALDLSMVSTTKDVTDRADEPLDQKLYPFQFELAENALAGKNTIICAPTGSGKTWVASYIMNKHLKMFTNGGEKGKVVFMARNGALVKQQMDFISDQLSYARIKHLTGDTDEGSMLNAFVEHYDIFLFTPQILLNNLNTDIKSLSTFSLMVFDECHHTKGGEPYNVLMKNYLLEKEKGTKNLPQIIGLTASIGTGSAKSEKEALDYIFEVCASLDVRCISTVEKHQKDLSQHVSVPTEEIIPMKKRSYDPCRSVILEEMKKTGDILIDLAIRQPKLIQTIHKRPPDIESKRYEIWTGEVLNLAETQARAQGRDIASCAKYLQVYCNALEVNRLLRTTDVAIYLATQFENEAQQTEKLTEVEKNLLTRLCVVQKELIKVDAENPNVLVMSTTLSNLFTDTETEADESRAMIFVHARATCRALADFLDEKLNGIYVKASPLIGKETRGTDKGMTEKEQTQIIQDFREGKFKVLVATSVGIEGLDVPDCNMTLNYNYNGNEITKIQMTGRSRKEKGKSVMIANDKQLEKDRIAMYRVKLMYGAVESFKKLDQNSVNRKILSVQKKMLDDFKWQLKNRELKRSKQSDEIDYEIQCRPCSKFLCNASDLRKHESSHLVAAKDFVEKIEKEEYSKRPRIGPLTKKFKMFCKECTNYLGPIGVKDEIEYFVLKLENLKFVSRIHPYDVTTYKKWADVPYKVKEIAIKDLTHIYDQ